jgi:uncharacterized protein
MFREMRRKKQLLSNERTERILAAGKTGILGVMGDDEYPYAVPVNYVYDHGKIYFHSAASGHKIDGIQRNNKVSFCVIEQDEIIPEKFATNYRSAIAFGKARIVTDPALKQHALELIGQKYSPGLETEGAEEIRKGWEMVYIVEISIDHLTGKEAIGFVNPSDEA